MIAVLGAGAFGSALALTIPGKVHLWGRSLARGATSSKRLPEYGFKEHILVTETIEDACKDADAILLAVPMAALRETAEVIPVGATP
ncbi:MAG: NAD(P)-binding domain-containing protein, partial [Pseudomonadota bacterium]